MRKSARERGQALVLVLLSLAVVLTMVLFILARTVTDIAVSTTEEEAIRAFSAAEAGIEKTLVIGAGGAGSVGDANFSANVSGFAEGEYSTNYPINLASGDTATFWFVSHDENENLVCDVDSPCFSGDRMKVCWGEEGTSASSPTTPAIEVSVFYDDGATVIGRAAFDPNSGRTASNSFSSPDSGTCQVGETTYEFQKTISFSNLGIPAGVYGSDGSLLFAKVRMFYNSDRSQSVGADVNFAGNDPLPSQGLLIDSTGSSGEANRRLEVFQAYSEAPSIFDFAVFNSAGLTK